MLISCEFELDFRPSVLQLRMKVSNNVKDKSDFFGFGLERSLHRIVPATSFNRCCDLISLEICHFHMANTTPLFYSHWCSIRDNCSLASNVNPSPFWVRMIVYKYPLMRQNQIYMDLRVETGFNLTWINTRLWGIEVQPVHGVIGHNICIFGGASGILRFGNNLQA